MYRAMKMLALFLLGSCMLAAASDQMWDQRWSVEPGEGYGEEMPASYLGIDVRDITSDRLSALKLKEEAGAEITMVDQDAPAGKAGLKEHDVILQLNGTKIESCEQLRRMLKETPPGRLVTLNVSRDGQPVTIKATLADRKKVMTAMTGKHGPNSFVMPPMPPMPPVEVPAMEINIRTPPRAGITIESLTPQLGEYFGVKNGEGVLVRAVEKGSPADQAGVKAGDIIIRVDKARVADRSDWREAMRKKSGKVAIGVIRDRKEQTITVTLPEAKSDESFNFDFDFDDIGRQIDDLAPHLESLALSTTRLSHEHIEKAMKEAKAQMKSQMDQACKEMDKAAKEMDKAGKELQKQGEKK